MSDEPVARIGGKFAHGNPGRPKGARGKLGEHFIKAMADDFEVNGIEVIKRARDEDPLGYLKVIAGLLPKEFTGEDGEAITINVVKFGFDKPTE